MYIFDCKCYIRYFIVIFRYMPITISELLPFENSDLQIIYVIISMIPTNGKQLYPKYIIQKLYLNNLAETINNTETRQNLNPATYLKHYVTNVINALCNRLSCARYCDRSFCGIGQHLRCHLYRGSCHFSDLLDLGTTLAYQRSALACRYNQPQGDGRSGYAAGPAVVHVLELGTPLRIPML